MVYGSNSIGLFPEMIITSRAQTGEELQCVQLGMIGRRKNIWYTQDETSITMRRAKT